MNGKQRILEILDALDGCGIIVDDLDLVKATLDELDVKNEFAAVVWGAEDVIDHAKQYGMEMTVEEAETFLSNNEKYIAQDMVERGFDSLDTLFCMEFPDAKRIQEDDEDEE